MNANTSLGRRGEDAAARYLGLIGWTIVERNWRCRQGEIDIVAHDGRSPVVCEVKTRSGTQFGSPFEAITNAKAVRLRRLAWQWAAARGVPGASIRVDVLCLIPAPSRAAPPHHGVPKPRRPADAGRAIVDGFEIEHLREVI
jgi:putative endonuclease